MIPGYTSFFVEVKNLKFITVDGYRYPKTAIVNFEVEGRTTPVVELLGYIEEEEIYQKIDSGEPVTLDQCYIGRFSLENYRSSRKLDKKHVVDIKGFSARNSLFDSSLPFDFSQSRIVSGKFDIEHSWVHRGAFNFDSTQFLVKEINFQNVKFSNYDFVFKNVKTDDSKVSFHNTQFGTGKKDFQYTEFGNGELSFVNTDFSDGDVSFINVHFGNGDVSFKVARFGTGRIDFHYAKFGNGLISFERTFFGNGAVDFRLVEFGSGKVNFNRSHFGDGDVSFEACEMNNGKLSFKSVRFGSGDITFQEAIFSNLDVSFERSNFGKGNISFYKSYFKSLNFRFCHLDDYVDLRLKSCKTIDLSDTIVRDIIDLNPYEFNLDVDIIRFSGMRLIGRMYLSWKLNDVKRLIVNQTDTDDRLKSEQFRILKENFNLCGQYEDEDRAYVEFKRYESKANLTDSLQKRPVNMLWSYPSYFFKKMLFDKAGLYATSPVRVLITMLTIYVTFSLIYVLLILTTTADIVPSVNDSLSVVSRSFYHSAITFLTIGYGDHFPFQSIRWVSSLEGFSGLFLMSYFTVAFVRKILR